MLVSCSPVRHAILTFMENDDSLKEEKRSEFRSGDNISKLQRRMYSRERRGFLPWRRRRKQTVPKALVPDDWEYNLKGLNVEDASQKTDQEGVEVPRDFEEEVGTNLGKRVFIFSLIFFIIAFAGSAIYLFVSTGQVQSTNAVQIIVEGPTTIASGTLVELQVLITNNNDKALELADMVVDFPDGTVSPVDFKTPMTGTRIPLGKIAPGDARRGTIKAVVFGNDDEILNIKIELEYRLKGSSALRSQVSGHNLIVSGGAMSIAVEGDTEVTPRQNTLLTVKVKSYASVELNGTYLDAELPLGVELVDSSPAPLESTGDTELPVTTKRWFLGELRPGEERELYISIKAGGNSGDKRFIKFSTGVGLQQGAQLGTVESSNTKVLANKEYVLEIKRPFLGVTLTSGGEFLSNAVAYAGRYMTVRVNWLNTLDVPLQDVKIKVNIGGSAFNKLGVRAGQNGFYRSVDSAIIWDSKTARDKLTTVPPGKGGTFTFKVAPLNSAILQQLEKPELTFDVSVSGKRLSESNVPEVLTSNVEYITKVATDVRFDAYALFNSGAFPSVGSLPPKAERETQYSITWEVSNTTSDVEDAKVTAELPNYVRWVGLTTPANEQVTYNKVDSTITWVLGKVRAGTSSAKPRRVTFAIGLVPSLSQLGTTPELIMRQTFSGVDTYTGELIRISGPNVTTRLEREPGFDAKDATVVK